MNTTPATLTYLDTAFKDKDRVKALGARWDPDVRRWYVPVGLDLAPFEAWLPARSPQTAVPAVPAIGTASTELAVPKGIALSQLLKGVASAVAQAYRSGVWTRVEVSRADTRGGHVYLELAERDAQGAGVAQARAMIWASTAAAILPAFERATGVVLAAGIKLLVRAKPVVHAVYGLSLEIDAIDPEYTLGDLEARKREIRERLQREGVFDANRRLPAPWDFNAVLVVAPEGAAGLGDFHAEAQRLQRFGVCRFVYAHSRFQGEGAPALIRSALLHALENWELDALPDAVVIIRGGGAVNDLAWLNDYALARCVCDLEVPVLTGIGHERDSTVLDEVAHRRFDTPSKVIAGIEQLIAQRARRAREHFEFVVHTARHQLQQARQETAQAVAHVRLQAVQSIRLGSEQSRSLLGEVRHQAAAHMGAARQAAQLQLVDVLAQGRHALHTARAGTQASLQGVLERAAVQATRARDNAGRAMDEVAVGARRALADGAQRSQALVREITGQGPHKTLGRGFAIVRRTGGAVVTGAAGLAAGEAIEIEFRDGTVAARTLKKEER
ncbi:exodeoxyribonuclease VII large subunit [uncultured Azohydromonas sp.]|jgi:Exonuclease VII, large subunit|uniref:exodeoxyribonuclease VII large subunit n=1 Tax=uncultured Azohydromonas sp. TaxID=487342 RepID=UPI0026384211|nr:exodeoxyribonuclease VII large subunit [uncultured Azohydromonas sp.]